MTKDDHSSNTNSLFKLFNKSTLNSLANQVIKTLDTVSKRLNELDTDEIKTNLTNLLSREPSHEKQLRTENGKLFSYKGHVSSLSIPDDIHTIKREAFLNNKTLEYIALPASLVTIEADAFKGCSKLKVIEFGSPSQLHTIEKRAFMDCTALESISFGSKLNDIQDEAFKGCTALREVHFCRSCPFERLVFNVFTKCTALKTIEWPKGIHCVFQSAIQDCPLSHDTLAELEQYLQFSPKRHAYVKPSVIRSDGYAQSKSNATPPHASPNSTQSHCENDNSLEEALLEAKKMAKRESQMRSTYRAQNDRPIIDKELLEMQRKAWQYDDEQPEQTEAQDQIKLQPKADEPQKIHTPEGLYLEGNELVGLDPGLINLVIPAEIHNIGSSFANQSSDIESIEVLGDIKKVNAYAFSGLTKLKSVRFHENVNHIAEHAFENCTQLASVQFDKALYVLGKYCFKHCTSLKDIRIPDTCGQINEGAFVDCQALKHVHLPKLLGQIPARLFCGCYQLDTIDMPVTCAFPGKDIIIDDTAFINTLSDLTNEQFAQHDGVLKREAVDMSKLDPNHIFDLRPQISIDEFMNIPQYIMNSALNTAFECPLYTSRLEFCIKLLQTCLILTDLITSTPQHDNRAEKLFAILRLRTLQNDLASSCHRSLEDALPYAISETLYAIGGNGSKRLQNVNEIEKIAKKYYDATSNSEKPDENRIYQANDVHCDVFVRQMCLYSLMKDLSIDEYKPNLYNPHAWKYAYPFVAKDTYEPCRPEYYDFVNGMKSILENQYGLLMSNGSDLSEETPETWFKTLGQATAESTEDRLHLVIFKTDEYIAECETQLKTPPTNMKKHYKYAAFLTPEVIQRIQSMLKEFDLQDILVDYSPSRLRLVE